MSRYEYPEDEFDAQSTDGPEPVGVHRAPVPAWHAWVPLLVVLILVPALAWGAVSLLSRSGHSAADLVSQSASPSAEASQEPSPAEETEEAGATEEATPSAEPEQSEAAAEPSQEPEKAQEPQADMTTGITVHNGGRVNGLAGRTGGRLRNAGYTAVTVQPGVYSQDQPSVTTIYYAGPAQQATAQAVGQALGITSIVESAAQAQSNPIVIVLRSDYQE